MSYLDGGMKMYLTALTLLPRIPLLWLGRRRSFFLAISVVMYPLLRPTAKPVLPIIIITLILKNDLNLICSHIHYESIANSLDFNSYNYELDYLIFSINEVICDFKFNELPTKIYQTYISTSWKRSKELLILLIQMECTFLGHNNLLEQFLILFVLVIELNFSFANISVCG